VESFWDIAFVIGFSFGLSLHY